MSNQLTINNKQLRVSFLRYYWSEKLMFRNKNWKKYVLLIIVNCSLIIVNCSAQLPAKYLITFKDKTNSPYSISKPLEFLSQRSINRRQKQNITLKIRDLPVNPAYISEIKKTGAEIWFTSRWMNAALIQTSDANLQTILKLPFVKGLEVNGTVDDPLSRSGRKKAKFEALDNKSLNYGLSKIQNEMLGVNIMHDLGFKGEGMMIAVLDAGFNNADKIAAFKPLFDENRIVGTYDFVKKEKSVYEDDAHGTEVLSCMGAFLEGNMVGTAPKASYLLLRSEEASSEYIIEEANWLFAAEYADSVGVDLINSSLGYTTFDDVKTNHTYAQLDGNTTIAARAADWAAGVGIVCVISAGNEGNDSWKYEGTPADADSVIAVGAVDANKLYVKFSSQGIPNDKRIKPDVVAMGQSTAIISPNGNVTTGSGTSFSSPILCGMVAGYWQANPTLTAMQIMENVRKSGSQAVKPDKVLGYGIPNLFKVLAIEGEVSNFFKVYPNPTKAEITIEIDNFTGKDYEAIIMDVSGRIQYIETLKNTVQTISIEKIPTGTYFLRVGNEEKKGVVKLIKE
ncbi:MAG: S8 family serine peptidase [Arcicella sp.]|nr:S8 family serine peptidase [Arcicella sp.]